MNAETAGHAGTPQLKLLVMENIKELRKRNRAGSIDGAMLLDSQSDQAISSEAGDGECERATGPGHKLQAREDSTANSTRGQVAEPQASSAKQQAASQTSSESIKR